MESMIHKDIFDVLSNSSLTQQTYSKDFELTKSYSHSLRLLLSSCKYTTNSYPTGGLNMNIFINPLIKVIMLSAIFVLGSLCSQAFARDEVCVYDQRDWQGDRFCTSESIRNLSDEDWNDDIASIEVDQGVEVIFGIPGVHNIEMYRGIEEAGITHVLARHEQGAGFMADGYARATGTPGVAYLITGPGLTNALTPLGQAYSDSVPVLAISSCLDETAATRGQLHQMRDQRAAAGQYPVLPRAVGIDRGIGVGHHQVPGSRGLEREVEDHSNQAYHALRE